MSAFDPQFDEVAEAIRKLTVAQTSAVINGRIGSSDFERGPGYWPLRHALYGKGLFCSANRRDVLTPLGRAVQVELEAQCDR